MPGRNNLIRNAGSATNKMPRTNRIPGGTNVTKPHSGNNLSNRLNSVKSKNKGMRASGITNKQSITTNSDSSSYSSAEENETTTNSAGAELFSSIGKMGGKLGLSTTLPIVGIGAGLFLLAAIILGVLGIEVSATSPSIVMEECSMVIVENTENNEYDREVSFESYVAGAIAAKGYDSNNIEFYKVLAIQERSELVQRMGNNCKINESNNPEPYIPIENSAFANKINEAVNATRGMVLSEDGMIYLDEIEIDETESLRLITEEGYSYEQVINKYTTEEIVIEDTKAYNIGTIVNGFTNPVANFRCSSGYGCRFHPIHQYYRIHPGVDLAASSGEPVYAAKAGTIEYVLKTVPGYSEKYSYGNYITITHEDGTKTRYAHLLYGSIPNTIYAGATVEQGQMIAKVGSTGTSTGAHLHYEIHINGSAVNPNNYLDLSTISNASVCNSNANISMSYCGY